MKTLWDQVQGLNLSHRMIIEDVTAVKLLVAGQYVPKNDFERFEEAIFRKLDHIELKIDGKADK